MASVSESGHAINVAHFEDLISCLQSIGERYDPQLLQLQLPALQQQLLYGQTCLSSTNKALARYTLAVDENNAVYKPLDKLITRVVNGVLATIPDKKHAQEVISLSKKIRGKRIHAAPKLEDQPADAAPKRKYSTSQRSRDMINEHFSQLIACLKVMGTYQPNEPDLTIDALTAVLQDLKTRKMQVITEMINLGTNRALRNKALYSPNGGLVDTARRIKLYIKAVLPANDGMAKKILKIKFRSERLG